MRVLAVHRGRVAMVTQHHYLHDAEITDLPGGLVDEREKPADAACRELAEETGLRAMWLYPLGTVATARAVSTETVHLFLAHGCIPGAASLDAGEAVRTGWRRWHEVDEGNIRAVQAAMPPALADAASLAAVHRAGALLRAVGGAFPDADADLPKAAWAAYTVAGARDPLMDERLSLVWLDVAIGRYAEGAAILSELESAYEGADGEGAWMRAADRYAALAQSPA
ncbi:NUDIX hydrolase [Streptomyces sp. NBC_00038]|uniref:NUDIX hydrolase n=1 Tax=Streptomyces sp. NBC_00038 TaxID=2903615 RepID=UPI00224CB7A2|nr:NUDIX hydrolase [Streptomyces sp. NBC_00038]MCX5555361.1 NUDIX hydrolase [Streptomyces sp. NBC_00038]